ncbi:hypothetical protein DV735_g427, partial [Chaetothyriales sp. CBS 134920]
MLLVPILIIVTFTIVVLSVIFGYCPESTTADSSTATLVFYLLTSPVALLLLLSVELILHHHYFYYYYSFSSSKPQPSHTSLLFNPNARLPSFILLLTHLATWLGFALATSFWTACELPPPTSTALERLCPSQVRGHFIRWALDAAQADYGKADVEGAKRNGSHDLTAGPRKWWRGSSN